MTMYDSKSWKVFRIIKYNDKVNKNDKIIIFKVGTQEEEQQL